MSLVQHVSSTEGVDRERDEDIDVESFLGLTRKESRQEISYDPLFEIVPPEKEAEHVGAYEVTAGKRALQVFLGVVTCILASGIVFGFAALKSVLVDENIYRDQCTEEELELNVHICFKQDLKLNFSFIIASVTTNISALLVGAVLDRYGPRVCGLISSVVLLGGALCMAFASQLPFDAIIAGSFLLALGGTFTFVPSFHLANAFPRLQGLILALITGAFDASAAIFLLFRLIYDGSGGNFGLKKFFLIYAIVPILILVIQLFIMPQHSYETRTVLIEKIEQAQNPDRDIHDSDDDIDGQMDLMRVRSERTARRRQSLADMRSVIGPEDFQHEIEKKEDERKNVSGVWGALHGIPAHRQMMTPWFILMVLLTVLQMARFNFFISTIWTQYRYMLQSVELADTVNDFFDIVLPIGGVATVPFIGLLLDNTSTPTTLSLIVLMSTIIGVLGAVPTLSAAYANVILFCIFRPLYYSAMSDYAAKVFGFATFGRVYGAIIFLSGIFTFAQAGLQALVHEAFDDDPGPMNLWLAGVGLIVGIMLVMYVDTKGRVVRQEIAEEVERRSLRPGSMRRPSRGSLRSLATDRGERQPLLAHKGSNAQLATVDEGSEGSDRSSQISR